MDRRALEKQQAEARGRGVRGGAILTEKCLLQRQQMSDDQEEERERSVDSSPAVTGSQVGRQSVGAGGR